ncbi:putative reverse transcriptase domain-containing protein [Tanacetum coccineum]
MPIENELTLEPTQQGVVMKSQHVEFDESNANVLERFYTSAGNPVKEILLKLNLLDTGRSSWIQRILKDGGEGTIKVKEFQRSFRHSDTERLSRSDEVLKIKNFKKDATLKLSKSTNQECAQDHISTYKLLVFVKVANGKSWTEVKEMMIDEFCPTEDVQRLEDELRHLKLRDMNIAAYTEMFNELALLCPDVVPNEKKKVELYIKGLPEIIKGETTSSRPTMLNDVVHMAHTLMEQKIQAKNERIAEGNKRRWENNNQGGSNNRNNNDNRNNNNRNNNNRGNYRDNNRHNHYNQIRKDGARAMTASQNNVVNQGGPTPK